MLGPGDDSSHVILWVLSHPLTVKPF